MKRKGREEEKRGEKGKKKEGEKRKRPYKEKGRKENKRERRREERKEKRKEKKEKRREEKRKEKERVAFNPSERRPISQTKKKKKKKSGQLVGEISSTPPKVRRRIDRIRLDNLTFFLPITITYFLHLCYSNQ